MPESAVSFSLQFPSVSEHRLIKNERQKKELFLILLTQEKEKFKIT